MAIADAGSCPIVNQFLPRIAMDLSEGGLQHDPAWAAKAWEALKCAYEHEGLRVPCARWLDFVGRADTYIRKWHLNLAFLNIHLISTGISAESANTELVLSSFGNSAGAAAFADRPDESGSASKDRAW